MIVGEATVVVVPSLAGFGPKVEAEVKKALAGVRAVIELTVSTTGLRARIQEAVTAASSGVSAQIIPKVDAAALRTEVRAAAKEATAGVGAQLDLFSVNPEQLVAEVKAAQKEAQAAVARGVQLPLNLDFRPTQIAAALVPVEAALDAAVAAARASAEQISAAEAEIAAAAERSAGVFVATKEEEVAAYQIVQEAAARNAAVVEAANARVVASAEGASATLGETAVAAGAAVASAAADIGLVAAAVGAVSLFMGQDFEAAMVRIQTNAGASREEVESMSKAVLGLAGQVGVAPIKLAEALFLVESSGLRGAAALDLLRFAAEGARVGNADLTSETKALTAILTSGIPGIKDAGDAVAQLNAIVGAGKITAQDLATSLSSGLLSVAANFGVDFRSVGAALDVLTVRGEPATVAATRLRAALALLAAPSKQATKILRELGLSTDEAAAAQNDMVAALEGAGVHFTRLADDLRQPNGIYVAIKDLQDQMSAAGLTSEQQAVVISRAFGGLRSATGIQTLNIDLDALGQSFTHIGEATARFGEDWTVTRNTLKQRFAEIRAGADALFIRLGLFLIPYVIRGLDAIPPAVDRFKGAWKTAAPVVEAAVGRIEGVLRRIGDVLRPVLDQVASDARADFDSVVTSVRDNWPLIQTTMSKVLAVIIPLLQVAGNGLRAISAGVRQVVEFIAQEWPRITPILFPVLDVLKFIAEKLADITKGGPVFDALVAGAAGAVGSIGGVIGAIVALEEVFGFLRRLAVDAWDGISSAAVSGFRAIRDTVSSVFDGIRTVASDGWGWVRQATSDAAGAVVGLVSDAWRTTTGIISSAFDGIVGFARAGWQQVVDLTDWVRNNVDTIIQALFRSILSEVTGGVSEIVGLFTRNWSAIADTTQSLFDAVVGFFSRLPGEVGQFVTTMANDAESLVSDMAAAVGRLVSDMISDVVGRVSDMAAQVADLFSRLEADVERIVSDAVSSVVSFFSELPGRIMDVLSPIPGQVARVASDAGTSFLNTIADWAQQAVNFLGELPGRIVGAFGDAGSILFGVGQAIIEGLIAGIESVAGRAVSAARRVVGDAVDAAKSLLGIGSPSKVFRQIGINMGEGMILGLRAQTSAVKAATTGMIGAPPQREFGGRVLRNQAYIVGERRAELFIPDKDGVILPQVPDLSVPKGLASSIDGINLMPASSDFDVEGVLRVLDDLESSLAEQLASMKDLADSRREAPAQPDTSGLATVEFTINGPLVTIDATFGPGSSVPDMLVAMRQLAQDEIVATLTQVLKDHGAGVGMRGPE